MTTINLARTDRICHRGGPGEAPLVRWWTGRKDDKRAWRKFWKRALASAGEFINFEVLFPRLGRTTGGT